MTVLNEAVKMQAEPNQNPHMFCFKTFVEGVDRYL